jgi:N-acetylglutamate synthase-like GNAT family acetyltransferase
MSIEVRAAEASDRGWMLEVVRGWGADFVITRGRKVYPADLPGFIAEDPKGKKIGLLTYEIVGDQCEIVTLDAFEQFSGIGSALMSRAADTARSAGCKRLWLITTNDNLDAVRFYQRRGMTIAAVHIGAIEQSRRLKPSIPEVGSYGIPIRDEIEFEMML